MKTYISGKISGLEYQFAKQKFEDAERLLTVINLKPVNPINNGLKECSTWSEHMIRDIQMLLECKAILMLSNWRESKGARIEKKIADEMGMIVLFEVNISKHYSFVQRVQNAIHETTGLLIRDYKLPDRSRLEYYSRLMFTYQCRVVGDIPLIEIAELLSRDKSTIYTYLNKYDDNFRFNPEFCNFATKVENLLSMSKAIADSVSLQCR